MSSKQVRVTLEDDFECATCQRQLSEAEPLPVLLFRKCGHYETLCRECLDIMLQASGRMLAAEAGLFTN